MRAIINRYLTEAVRILHIFQIPSYTGTYFISPKPFYQSQFIDIYPSSITLKTPLINKNHIKIFGAKNSKEFSFWAWRDCGIACIKMALDAKNKAKNKTLMDLTNEGIQLGGYIVYKDGKFVDQGWFHSGLVALLGKYDINAKMKKLQSVESVTKAILENKLVILSVNVPGRSYIKTDGSFKSTQDAKYCGHLLLAVGVKMVGKDIKGIYVHDPRGLAKYQKNTYIPKDTFNKIFTNRTIVVS